jgi:hypothetical protein
MRRTGRAASRPGGKTVVLGVEQEIVVLELAHGLSVTLPMQRAREQLWPLVSEADVRRMQEALRVDGALSGDVWVKRVKQGKAKLRAAIRWSLQRSCVTARVASGC